MRIPIVAACVALGLLVFQQPAQAYLDPGSGSVLLQVLLGGFAALGVAARLFWHRLTGRLRRDKADAGRR